MPFHGGLPCESLLAHGLLALVWSLAGVNSPMPRKGAGVTERLRTSVYDKNAREIMTYLFADFTRMRLFACVCSDMHCQSRTLDEALIAARVLTGVRLFVCMNLLCNGVSQDLKFKLGDTHHVCQDHSDEQIFCRSQDGHMDMAWQ